MCTVIYHCLKVYTFFDSIRHVFDSNNLTYNIYIFDTHKNVTLKYFIKYKHNHPCAPYKYRVDRNEKAQKQNGPIVTHKQSKIYSSFTCRLFNIQ